MSKVKIQGNASGTGTLTITAPNTNTDRNITLPDGAGEIFVGDITSGDLPSGSVLQVVQGTSFTPNVNTYTTSTGWTEIGLSGTITPSASGNKILILIEYHPKVQAPTGGDLDFYVQLLEGSTQIHEVRTTSDNLGKLGDTVYHTYIMPMMIYRTTSGTSPLTYKIQFACGNTGRGYYIYEDSTMTLMEIAQ